MSNYASKNDLKNATDADPSDVVKKADLATLKWDVDKLDNDKLKKLLSGLNSLKSKGDKLVVDKLKPVSVDLRKLRKGSY